ncbi:Hypothetical_protein [Hexamita inflata]|uniref:Hypothetical_protein n=1 Tax=Hexamita inflata TaxID=28002 RepID=A0AA86NNI3_9EUKA|nr:Hypothetical protein HINF_LOCUS11247 [Hexamita inflata]
MCIEPFNFNGLDCECSFGYLLDGNECVDILFLLKYLNQTDNQLERQLMNNVTQLNQQLMQSWQQAEENLKRNTSNLQNIIMQQNIQIQKQIDSVNQSLLLYILVQQHCNLGMCKMIFRE